MKNLSLRTRRLIVLFVMLASLSLPTIACGDAMGLTCSANPTSEECQAHK